MPELVKRGYSISWQRRSSNLAQKTGGYEDDDAQLNRIVIQLGTDEVRLRHWRRKKRCSQKQLSEILELLEALDKYAMA